MSAKDSRGGVDRRSFLRGTAQAVGAAAVAGPLQALLARNAAGEPLRSGPGYGKLIETPDETTGSPLLKLPRGFRYLTFGWTGDPLDDGSPTPPMHDGMAVAEAMYDRVVLVRNHELSGDGTTFAGERITYDPKGPGGTSNLVFNCETGKLEKSWASIGGTVRNCAGGPTPWGSWLTCEETVDGPGDMFGTETVRPLALKQTHGWIFEVPASRPAAPVPISDMGRFVHEAVAVDPATGYVYETEDKATSGFYRFIPRQYGLLHLGGKLQMLKATGREDLRKGLEVGEVFKVQWVDIQDPTLAHSPEAKDGLGVFSQGRRQGGAIFDRLEGGWHHSGLIYFISTSGGDAGAGQVWEYNPRREQLRLIFESPNREVLDHPDNMTVSPRG
ncbi:MAG: DUF839 domain-containing protein, partial [Planctomycetes bacterium]|nr:DUF839 domain-containing protein [Planctomycetota bacterium]